MSESMPFWERRRAAVRAEAEVDARAQAARDAADLADAEVEKDDAAVLEEMGLPNPEALMQGDDFKAFMAKEVPQHLRNKALRVLWRSNPVLACVDGLNEYDDDYRAAMLAAEPIKTAYQVGKGMMAHIEEMARQAEVAADGAGVSEPGIGAEPEEPEHLPEPRHVAAAPEAMPSHEDADICLNETDETEVPLRRMRFRFDEVQA